MRYALIDTRSINYCVDKPSDPSVKRFLDLMSDLAIVPFVTYHQLEEIACHADKDLFLKRMLWLSRLPHIGFLKQPHDKANVGSAVDIRDKEIEFILNNKISDHQEIIAAIKPNIVNGFCSGEQFVNANIEWWEIFQEDYADKVKWQKEEVINLTHFDTIDPTLKLPAPNTLVTSLDAADSLKHFERLAKNLANKIEKLGDNRMVDHVWAADNLMKEAYEESNIPLGCEGTFNDIYLKPSGIDLERLPKSPTIADSGSEFVFINQLKVYARRLGKSHEELIAGVRKEQLPSWIVSQALQRQMKKLPRASIGNINDQQMAGFGPYLDVVDVDKRTADCLRQVAQTHPTLKIVYDKVPKNRGFKGFVEALK